MVLLSFDTEEFDVPREHGVDINMDESMRVSIYGIEKILNCLAKNRVKATFFCTGNFAINAPMLVKKILEDGHEIACHGVDHWNPQSSDVKLSKQIVEKISGSVVYGYRQPRMFPVSDDDIENTGYLYNSSLNPAFVPGRYMHLTCPRTIFMRKGVMEIPASVTPWFRFPLFWLSYHNMPVKLYHALVKRVVKHDGYFVIYFHPWEFYPLNEHPEYKIPFIIRNHCGLDMENRLDSLIKMLIKYNEEFVTFKEFYDQKRIGM
jgi:peptidoglycan/xylan/chitin deacetylase (PgdA/CDA1 family)